MLKDLPCGLVLLYHRLGSPAHDPWNLFLEPDLFGAQMRLLAEHWPVVSLSQGLRRLAERQPGHWVAVTFDDAYRDVSEIALPRLRPGQILTVFACTHEPEREFWWDRLDDPALQPGLRASPDPHWEAPNRGLAPRLQPQEIAELARFHEVGSHGHRHLSLPTLEPDRLAEELQDSRQLLQHWTGQTVAGLAYPFGDHSHSVRALAGGYYDWACGVQPGLVWKGSPRLALPRYWAPRLEGRAFYAWLCQQGLS